ncbi:hypothetical protein M0R72_15145 [Candidatus Pacearchaeota archaeon]|jgi:hypothetical protein|nr:hypothetical protein [Candidatus Pacearchaeota archaeon]
MIKELHEYDNRELIGELSKRIGISKFSAVKGDVYYHLNEDSIILVVKK